MRPGSGIIFTFSSGTGPDSSELESSGVNSILAPSFLDSDPAEATVTWLSSTVAGSLVLSPSRMLYQAT